MLLEAYTKAAFSERSHRELFDKFEKSEFDVDMKEYTGRPKVYEGGKFEVILETDKSKSRILGCI